MSEPKNTAEKPKVTRHRSPAYPAVNLQESIDKVGIVFQADKRAYTSSEAILSHLGFKGSGGSSRRIVSAMRQYGLLEEDAGRYRVTEEAFKIIHLSEESPDRWALIRKAALTPPIIGRLLEFFDNELPSDATLKEHLIIQEKFNPDSVDLFIRVLRETLNFAKIPSIEYNALNEMRTTPQTPFQPEPDPVRRNEIVTRTLNSTLGAQLQTLGVPVHPGKKLFPFYLSKDQEATLYVPALLTQKEYDQLKKQIENSLAVMEATIISDEE